MADKPMSPFSGLDKALLRSTRPPLSTPTKKQQHPDREEPTTTAASLPSGTQSTMRVEPEQPTEEEPQKQVAPVRPYDRTRVRPDESTPGREYERPPSPLQRRKLVRHPFEFYEDQVERLRHLSLEAQLRGEKTSMSEMAREAIDTYLEKKKSRTPVR